MITIEEINKLAFAGKSVPDDLNCAERCLFLTLKDIYRDFKAGEIAKETGEKLKRDAISAYHKDVSALEFADKILRHNATMWASIERTANAYRKEKTIEAADAFIDAVYRSK